MSVTSFVIPVALYALVASPVTYQATRSVLGSWVATGDGLARTGGLILHAIVFVLLAMLVMRLVSKNDHTTEVSRQQEYGMSTKLVEIPHILTPAPLK